jgi:hypothetical protein
VIIKSTVAAALLLFLAAGCGSGGVPVDSPSSPLGNGGDPFQECVPSPPGKTTTDGITALENHSTGTVTVESVSFYGANHLLIVHAVVVPIHYDAIGFSESWPPARDTLTQPGVQWDKRVPAIGAKLPPFRGRSLDLAARLGLLRNLVLGIRPTARKGTAAGVQVRYRENGQQYELRTHTRIVVLVDRNC